MTLEEESGHWAKFGRSLREHDPEKKAVFRWKWSRDRGQTNLRIEGLAGDDYYGVRDAILKLQADLASPLGFEASLASVVRKIGKVITVKRGKYARWRFLSWFLSGTPEENAVDFTRMALDACRIIEEWVEEAREAPAPVAEPLRPILHVLEDERKVVQKANRPRLMKLRKELSVEQPGKIWTVEGVVKERKVKTYSQSELAGKVGITARWYRELLKKPDLCTLDLLKAIANEFGYELSELEKLHRRPPATESAPTPNTKRLANDK